MGKISVRQHVLSPAHGLDRVKLSIQRGPLGSFDREDGERLAVLWNLADGLTLHEIAEKLNAS